MREFRLFSGASLLAAMLLLSLWSVAPAAAQERRFCPCGVEPSAGRCVPDPRCMELSLGDRAPASDSHRRAYRPAARQSPQPTIVAPNAEISRPANAPGPRARILGTGYEFLNEIGRETPGYGLYSYVIMPTASDRANVFLSQVFRDIPAAGDTGVRPANLNLLYIPLRKGSENALQQQFVQTASAASRAPAYMQRFYDFRMAGTLLVQICDPPHPSVKDLCEGSLAGGPYIFTYAQPASRMKPVQAPFLFVDLTGTDPRAFGEVIDAFRAQVKRDDISDQARINTLRLRLLNFILAGSSVVNPIRMAVKEIVSPASAAGDKKTP